MRFTDARFLPDCACGRKCPVGKRKCINCLKSPRKVTQGRPVTKGANARGIAAHKPDRSRTRKAKRQHPELTGIQPMEVKAYRMRPDRADRKPKEQPWL